MTEATPKGDEKTDDRAGEAPDQTSSTPAADDATRQDKTKDKPDSGQNEDG